ncbi:MAG: hypothetical protein HWD61_11905 [Parachlamydiaceae bacterium]|nr:MAG: hypothetical protein HWD61_11905 [Parachlamydiaceae bacterium]
MKDCTTSPFVSFTVQYMTNWDAHRNFNPCDHMKANGVMTKIKYENFSLEAALLILNSAESTNAEQKKRASKSKCSDFQLANELIWEDFKKPDLEFLATDDRQEKIKKIIEQAKAHLSVAFPKYPLRLERYNLIVILSRLFPH